MFNSYESFWPLMPKILLMIASLLSGAVSVTFGGSTLDNAHQ